MKITTGIYRGRKLTAPEGLDIRPTSDKVRQAVFNIVQQYGLPGDAIVMDVFCGTGALGLEALSRGAKACIFIDNTLSSLQCCRANIAALKAEARVLHTNAALLKPRPSDIEPADLVFLDPPYRKNLVEPALQGLIQGGWLAKDAVIVAEMEKHAGFAWPPSMEILSQRSYGDTEITLARFSSV
jgi:16S rRNA (guanine966-N2)-methyltransferase